MRVARGNCGRTIASWSSTAAKPIAGGAGDSATLLADAQTTRLDPSGSLHAANAAAFLLLNGDGDANTAHALLAGAIKTGGHGWSADDPALDEAMHALLLLSWYAGTPDHWAVFYRAMDRLTPGPSDILSVMAKTLPDPARTGAAARPELEALLHTLATEEDLTRVARIGTASIYLDRLGDNREWSWRLVSQGREGGAPRRQLVALMHLCLDGYLTGRWDDATVPGASHALPTSQPQVVADFILKAAAASA